MSLNVLIAFWAVSVLFIITPGADWAYAISAGLKGRVVAPAVTGLLSGHFIATLIVAAGVGTLVASHPVTLSALTAAGAIYLAWLGFGMLAHPSVPNADETHDSSSWGRWALKGLCVSGLNPKVFLLFLAMLPQFTSTSAPWSVPAQIIALGSVHTLTCGFIYVLVALGSRRILSARPAVARQVSRLSGATMIVIAIVLLAEQLLK